MSDRIIVDIIDRSLNEYGDGPLRNVRGFQCTDPIDRAGTFSFSVPANDPWFDSGTIELRSHLVQAYIDGTLIFTGIIERTQDTIDQTGTAMVSISGRSLIAELAEVSVDFLNLSSGSDGVQNGPAQVLSTASAKLSNTWSLATSSGKSALTGITTTGRKIYAKFAGESALTALIRVTEHLNGHIVPEMGSRHIFYTGGAFNDSGLIAGQGGHDPVGFEDNDNECIIQSFSREVDGMDVLTRIYPYGGGQGETRLTIAPYNSLPSGLPAGTTVNRAGNYVEYNPHNFPRVEKHVEFKDIVPISNTDADVRAAANALVMAASSYLTDRAVAPNVYRIRVGRVPDLQALRPSTTIRVVYQDDAYSIDDDLYIHDVQTQMGDDGALTHTLIVSDEKPRPVTADEWQASQMQQGQVFQSHQQMGPNVTTISYRESLDDDYDATMRFWLGDEIAQIQQVLLRYRIDPLRSTVKSTGGSSTSTGPSSISSSASGGGATPTSGTGNHTHPINIPAGVIAANVGLDASNNVVNDGSVVGNVVSLTESGGHTHSVTIPAHTHNIEHTHNVTASISTSYGVFEESGANTYGIGDLDVAINGTTLPSGERVDLGGGWYAYDLTEEVQNSSTLRPNQESNTVTVSQTPNGSKSGQISAQIQVRAIIQSVSYS